MALKLTDREINTRLQKLRNYERLYPRLKRRCEKLERENKELRRALEQECRERLETVEAINLRIEELREMVFGRKRGDGDDAGSSAPSLSDDHPPQEKKTRSSLSYRRSLPKEEAITQETFHGIDRCPDCGEPLADLRGVVRYIEDIVLPALRGKTVEKKTIETGFCRKCRRWHSAIPISKQMTALGDNVRQRIVHCITVLSMTFETVRRDLKDAFDIDVSDGEIVLILTGEAAKLLPEYHDIDARIRGSPAKHLDETSWPVQKEGEGNWGLVKTASDTCATLFRLGRSRGKGNAQALHSDKGQPTITDDYGAYDFLGEDQALCWAHPKRKFKDLATSVALESERRDHCARFYEHFCRLLREVKTIVRSPYNQEERRKEAGRLRPRIRKLCTPCPADPRKLATLKATFLKRTEAYLLCVRLPNIPLTNNKAERALRPLVIKRKLSFGSKTQKGADVMSILLSVCSTLRQQKPRNFYEAYREIVRKWKPT